MGKGHLASFKGTQGDIDPRLIYHHECHHHHHQSVYLIKANDSLFRCIDQRRVFKMATT